MQIEIFTDFACPFCYIGKRRLQQAIEQLGLEHEVDISYKAYQLNPYASKEKSTPLIKEGASSEKLDAILAHAKEVGLTYHLEKVKVGNSENAHRLAKWAKTKGKESVFIEEVFHRYFTEGLDLNEADELVAVASAIGLQAEEARQVLHDQTAFQQEFAMDLYDIQQIPVTSVPFFVFENRYGIKGVEPLEVFTKTLKQTKEYVAKQNALRLQGNNNNNSCSMDGCQ